MRNETSFNQQLDPVARSEDNNLNYQRAQSVDKRAIDRMRQINQELAQLDQR